MYILRDVIDPFHFLNDVFNPFWYNTVEPRYNEVLGTMKVTLLYQVIISG